MCATLAYLLLIGDPVVVDRLYDRVAVVATTDGTVVDVPRAALPADAVEGGSYQLQEVSCVDP